jgi:O-antigen/teichoic acid export membrane protein
LLFKAVTGSFVAIALASIAVTLFLDARLARQFGWSRPRLDRKLAALAKTALPMAIVALLYSLHVAMPRFFLEQTSNRQTLGQFAGLLNLVSVAAMGAQAVSVTLSPRMAEAYHEGKFHQFIKLIGVLLVTDLSIALFLFGVTSTYGQSLLLLAYNHEIGAAASALPHFVLATGLMLIELHIGVIQTAMRRFRQQVIVQFVKLASAACLYWLAHFSNDLIAAVGVLSLSYLIAIFVGIVFVVSGLNRRPVPSAPLRG